MRILHIISGGLLALAIAAHGQVTTGYHRVGQVLARGSSGVEAVIQPYSTVAITSTATGFGATVYSDPLLTAPILPSVVTADDGGNYDYYIPLGYCVTETISYPSSGGIVIPNICVISSTTSGTINAGTTGQLTYYAANGTTLSGETLATIAQGGTNAATAAGAWTNILAGSSAAANTVLAGPTTGSAAPLVVRGLVSADIPNNAANTSGNANTATLAATATALAGSPTQCTGGQVATGIAASGNANCTAPGTGLTQINGGGTDATTPSGGGIQPLTLNTVNGSPGTCGDATHVCQVTTDGKGRTTAQSQVSITYPSGPVRTCNADGCYQTYADGTIHAWGITSVVSGTPASTVLTITYPTTFTVAPVPGVSPVSAPAGGGSPCTGFSCPVTCNVIRDGSMTVTGATVGMSVGEVLGSGFSSLSAGDYCKWTADGN